LRAESTRKIKISIRAPHRPLILTHEQGQILCGLIRNGCNTGNFVPQKELFNSVENMFGKALTYGWLNSFLSRHSQEVKRAIVSPQELPRLQTPRCYLQGYIDLLRVGVPLVPSELTFNLDETDLSDWEERKPKPVLVTIECGSVIT
jgi:hypothetical protein